MYKSEIKKSKIYLTLKVSIVLILVISVISILEFKDIGPQKVEAESSIPDSPDSQLTEDAKNNPGLFKKNEAYIPISNMLDDFEVNRNEDEVMPDTLRQDELKTDTVKQDQGRTKAAKEDGLLNTDTDYIRILRSEYNRLIKEYNRLTKDDQSKITPEYNRLTKDAQTKIPEFIENVEAIERIETSTPKIESTESLEAEYERLIREDEARIIPDLGEGGLPSHMVGIDFELSQKSLNFHSVNVHLSDRISYQRNLTDVRNKKCKNVTYDAELPSASVVIIFENEPYSMLLRTVWSVLNTCRRAHPWYSKAATVDRYGNKMHFGYKGQNTSDPYIYLKEIILVDDSSFLPELKGKLDHYIKTRLPTLVKIVRLPKNSGLMVARLSGARAATGDVLVFLDGHCEAQPDWLRPMLQRIKDGFKGALVPIIDVLERTDFGYVIDSNDHFSIGGFKFDGQFMWIEIPSWERERRGSNISPTRTPTMAGGLFAIEREYFWHMGGYDDQMLGWGSENIEISFRIWMCGGMIECIPCSRVAHMYRTSAPYRQTTNTYARNTARLAEVWMDDYAEILHLYRPEFRANKSLIGDVTERKKLREKLQCKSFDWYLKNVYREKFVPIRDSVAFGRIRNPITRLCLDTLHMEAPNALALYQCSPKIQYTQEFSLSHTGQLRREKTCIIGYNSSDELGDRIYRVKCPETPPEPEWKLLKSGQILHLYTGLCLCVHSPTVDKPDLKPCREDDEMQQWMQDIKTMRNGLYYDSNLISRSQIEVLRRLPKLSPLIRWVEDVPPPVAKDNQPPVAKDSSPPIAKHSPRPIAKDIPPPIANDSPPPIAKDSPRNVAKNHGTSTEIPNLYYDQPSTTPRPIFLDTPESIYRRVQALKGSKHSEVSL